MYEIIILCLEQKLQLATEIMNCTKQIEVKLRQEEVDIVELLKRRDGYRERLIKCDALLEKSIQALPLPDQGTVSGVLKRTVSPPEGELAGLAALQEQFLERIRQAETYNREAISAAESGRETVKKRLDKIKGQKAEAKKALEKK